MTKIPAALDHMLAAWNERDLEKIRGHLDKALAADVIFADPDNFTRGIDEFEKMVRVFRERLPEGRAERTSGFNLQNRRYRYEWLVSSGETLLIPGMDVAELDENGRVIRVDGFFGPVPPLSAG